MFCADNYIKAQFEIKGCIYKYDSSIIALNGKVGLYEYSNDGREDTLSDHLLLKSNDSGFYVFQNVLPGMYYIGVDFFDEGYVVSYFGGDIYWNDAEVIIVDTFSVVARDIFLSKIPNKKGY